MAFSKGKESSNGGGSFSRYVGVGSVKVLAVNPNMEEWNTITGGNMTKEPEYTGVTQDGVKTARITLLVQTDPAKTIGGEPSRVDDHEDYSCDSSRVASSRAAGWWTFCHFRPQRPLSSCHHT